MPPAAGPAWEALTAQAAMLAAFGAMLMWLLKVATKKQDDALAQLVAMTNQIGRLVETQGAMAIELRLRYERLATDAGSTAKLLADVVDELRDMRQEDDKRTQAIRDLASVTQQLVAAR